VRPLPRDGHSNVLLRSPTPLRTGRFQRRTYCLMLIKPGYPFQKSIPSRRRNAGHALLSNPIPFGSVKSRDFRCYASRRRSFHIVPYIVLFTPIGVYWGA
jgi:hypothetical protein